MEGKALTDNIIRNIVSEVLRECKNHRIRASAEFIAYYINLLELDPNRGLTNEFLTNREKVQTFIKYVVDHLGAQNDPRVVTLRLQHEFRSFIKELDDTVVQFRSRLNNRLYPLLLDIVEQDRRNTGAQLYQKICYYVTLASGLGNPNEKLVFKEALQVLKSILSEEDIEVFPSLQNYIKQELLVSLEDIITGIRLYNKSCKKGGEGMADLPELMKKALAAVRVELSECIDRAVLRAQILTRYVEKNMVIIKRSEAEWGIVLRFKSAEEKKSWEYTRDLAAAHRQLSKTTRILLQSITELDKHRHTLNGEFKETIETLNAVVIPTLHQAVTVVFPHFTQLAAIWKEFQNDAIRLKGIFNIFKMQAHQIFNLKLEVDLDDSDLLNQPWLEKEDDKLNTDVDNHDVKIHANTEQFTKQSLEFHGYCCWALTNTGGALIPAVIPLGVVEYKQRYYGFSSKMAANCFSRDPESYILKTIELARKWVHLIKFLDLEERLRKTAEIKTLVKKKEQPLTLNTSQSTQTKTHIQEPYIDRNYTWNIWTYKRNLLKHRDLLTKVTRSTETDKVWTKGSMHTQTDLKQDCSTQTKSDNYGNTKRPLNFIHGLRGLRGNYPFVMDLTEPLRCSQIPQEFINKTKKR